MKKGASNGVKQAFLPIFSGLKVSTTILIYICIKLYVTVHAKTSPVRTKIEINFLSPAYSYTH